MLPKILLLSILAVVTVYQILLDVLEYRSAGNPLPANVQDIYDAEAYEKWTAYHHEKVRHSIFSTLADFVIAFAMFLSPAYPAFAGLFPENAFLQGFAVLLLSEIASLLLLPLSYYDTMHIEGKYGFNRSTVKTFISDAVKGFLIDLLLMAALMAVCLGLYGWLGIWALPLFVAVLMLLVLVITFLSPVFSRIFNRFTPLPDGELKECLTALLTRNGYTVRAIEVMDASRRSSKSNAYFTGLGKMKTIVLYDTLIEAMTTEEIIAVFAHELGHGLHHDTTKLQWLNTLQMLFMACCIILNLSVPAICTSFGFTGVNYGFGLLAAMGIEMGLVAPLTGLLVNAVSRRAEFAADAQAVREGYGDALVSALKKLSRENFSNLAPDKLTVLLTYSHPPIDKRIEAIEKGKRN